MDGDQPVDFYWIDPGLALEQHAGKSNFNYQNLETNSIISMNKRSHGSVLVFALLVV
jgi:hypothetical protein